MKTNEELGKFTTPAEVRLVRVLPGPIERIWAYLTDPEKRARWFAGGPMEPKKGGKAELFFLHKNIAPDETPPEDHKQVQDPGFKMPVTARTLGRAATRIKRDLSKPTPGFFNHGLHGLHGYGFPSSEPTISRIHNPWHP